MINHLKLVFYFFVLIPFFYGFGQEEQVNFIKLNKTFSPSSYMVEDNLGYLRIFDREEAYNYDGYSFKSVPYQFYFGVDFTKDKNFVAAKDNLKNLWIGSFKGELTKIDINGNKTSYKKHTKQTAITVIKPYKKNVYFGSAKGAVFFYNDVTNSIDSLFTLPTKNKNYQKIRSIAFSNKQNIWLSTAKGDVYYYQIKTKTLKQFNKLTNTGSQTVNLTHDNTGNIWFATEYNGLFSYNPVDSITKQYDPANNLNTASKHHVYLSIFIDDNNIIWAGTDGDGLVKINPKNKKVTVYRHNVNNLFSLSSNTIIRTYIDSKKNLWAIDKKGIINVLPRNNSAIKNYNGIGNHTRILSVLKSSKNSLFVGSDGKGLYKILPNNTIRHYYSNTKNKNSFNARYIQNLTEDANGNIWIATYTNGLWIYNQKNDSFKKIKTIQSKDVRTLFKDSKNRIWVATTTSINIFKNNQTLIAQFKYNNQGLTDAPTMSITEDENQTIWLGARPNHLFEFNENLNNLNQSYFAQHTYFKKNTNNIKNYEIITIRPDYKGYLWILCASGELIKYHIKSKSYQSLSENSALKGFTFSSFLVEDTNNIWLTTNKDNGIVHYNVNKNSVKLYQHADGIKNRAFTIRSASAFKDKNGVLYFGGDNGIDAFSPSKITKVTTNPKLQINNLEILNKPASKIIPKQLKNGVENLKTLRLNYQQSSFSFQFSAIYNLTNPNYHYTYMLDGFDKDWINATENRTATYTNIPHGSYIFKVKAGTNRGIWDIDPIYIHITITPPWWQSKYAYLVYFILFLLIIYGIIFWLKFKNKLVKETLENNKEKELYALKMNFFAKMSHEIQTPLTLISGPISDMLKRANESDNKLLVQRLTMINNNANRLSRIAMELMTVRNKELGKLKLYASKNNIVDDLKRISQSFCEQARFKQIDFIQEYPSNDIYIWYDVDKIEHILYNLLSNAFKFTPNKGKVTLKVTVNENKEHVKIMVQDSGMGIPNNELTDIFKLFYQSNSGKNVKGSGIGLALTKDLVKLHKGKINVTSSKENGTCFSVKLSTKDHIFSEKEKVQAQESNIVKDSIPDSEFKNLDFDEKEIINQITSDKKFTLLIIEDNIEMQMFLTDIFSSYHNLLIASNGKEGIELAEKHIPDLIISDIMMPTVDGIEMCKQLQKRKTTHHIPIILLTAKNKPTTQIKGLNAGAIEYLQKPFNFYELLLKVNNILNAKEKIISNYKTDAITTVEENKTPSKDLLFLQKLIDELNSQLENPNFKLEHLTNTFNMSYSVIYRKYQKLTDKTLVELVKSLKLKKAALYIIKQGYSIAEAAYAVGYKDTKYFTKSFKAEFGITPSTLKKEAKVLGLDKTIEKYKIKPQD